jgi:hypothetical protein
MNCEILETLYVKSNGDILCNDDAGEQKLLGRVIPEDPGWNISSVLESGSYQHIRSSLCGGVVPWPDLCPACAFLRKEESFSDLLKEKRLRKLQIEPSLACNLCCPCCANSLQLQSRAKPHLMDLKLITRLLGSLSENGYQISEIEYCGQGEPLMNPYFANYVKTARQVYPAARQRLITNGNFDYQKTIAGEFIEEIIVSCDGAYQASYEKYRVRGNIERVFRFMNDIPAENNERKQLRIWKYILFEFNDRDEELITAQHLAQSLGIDTLMFVFTHSPFKSLRYPPEAASHLPILFPNVVTSLTPIIFNRDIVRAIEIKENKRLFSKPSSLKIAVDEVSVARNGYVTIRGWILAEEAVESLHIALDKKPLGEARLGLPRLDVYQAFPRHNNRESGFVLTAPFSSRMSGKHKLTLAAHEYSAKRAQRKSFTIEF